MYLCKFLMLQDSTMGLSTINAAGNYPDWHMKNPRNLYAVGYRATIERF